MRLLHYITIPGSCIISRKEKIKTLICVLHYNDILHIAIGNAFQYTDVLFAYIRGSEHIIVIKYANNKEHIIAQTQETNMSPRKPSHLAIP